MSTSPAATRASDAPRSVMNCWRPKLSRTRRSKSGSRTSIVIPQTRPTAPDRRSAAAVPPRSGRRSWNLILLNRQATLPELATARCRLQARPPHARGWPLRGAYALAVALDLFAGIRVRDYQAATSWYQRLLGREPAFFPHATEAVWELAEHRYLFIEENPDAPGGANLL